MHMMDTAKHKQIKHTRQRWLATETELADTHAQRDNDRRQFVKTLMATVVIMTVLFIVAVSF